MLTRGVLALACLVACHDGSATQSFDFSVRRFVDIPRSTGVGTLLVEAERSDPNASVSISLDDPPPGLTADPLEMAPGTTTGNLTLHAVTPIDADVRIIGRTSSGLVTKSHTRVKSDLVGGLLDDRFGEHGITASLAGSPWICPAALGQPDGKVLILSSGGIASAGSVYRITGDGVLDPTYGIAGVATIPTPAGRGTVVKGGFLQPDGNLLAYGFERLNDQVDRIVPRVWRLMPDGSPDGSFRLDPRMDAHVASVDFAALRPDGGLDVFFGLSSTTRSHPRGSDG